MSRDPGDIPPSWDQIDLATALAVSRDMPAEAIDRAAARPDKIVLPVLAALERAAAGETVSERDQNLLFWGLHALAEARESRLLPPLLRLLRRPDEELDRMLGDAITETLPRIVTSLYAGDWPALREAILDRSLNDIARWQLLLAAACCTADGRISAADMASFLAEMDERRLLGSSDHGWYGWESAIGLLGLSDLAPRVDAARRDGRLLEDLSGPEDFAELLDKARKAPDDLSRFAEHGLGEFGRAVDELDALLSLQGDDHDGEPDAPVRNPWRDVGRNDPCPCGSGKKFKKCCLEAA